MYLFLFAQLGFAHTAKKGGAVTATDSFSGKTAVRWVVSATVAGKEKEYRDKELNGLTVKFKDLDVECHFHLNVSINGMKSYSESLWPFCDVKGTKVALPGVGCSRHSEGPLEGYGSPLLVEFDWSGTYQNRLSIRCEARDQS
jgi:hypothetical protein